MIALLCIPLFALMSGLTASIALGSALGVFLSLCGLVLCFVSFAGEGTLEVSEEQDLCQDAQDQYSSVKIPCKSLEWIDPYSLEFMISQYEETQSELEASTERPIIKDLEICKICNIMLPPNMKHYCFAEPKINIERIDTIPIPINSKKVLLN